MGIKGYNHPGRKHPVVAVNPDGTVAGCFDFIKDAVALYGMDRHSITDSCRKGTICRGLRWYYEEDFKKIFMEQRLDELKFELDPNRDPLTYHFRKGHKCSNGWHKRSEEKKAEHRERVRERSRRLNKTEGSNWGKQRKAKPANHKEIICIDTGEVFYSIAECARHFGVNSTAVHAAVKRFGKCKGYTFRYYSLYKDVANV